MTDSAAAAAETGTGTEAPAAAEPSRVAEVICPDLQFVRDLRAAGGDAVKACYQCATCSVTCELSPVDAPFPRKEMLWAQWGLKDRLLADPAIFLCYQCNDCSTRCPRGAKPGDVMAALRAMVYQVNAFPSFMGKALNNPKAMLALFLVPFAVLFGMLFLQHRAFEGDHGEAGFGASLSHMFGGSEVIYHHFLAHGLLEMLFMAGNVFIFTLAAIGFYRYYNTLKRHSRTPVKLTFAQAVVATVKEIVLHKRFRDCGQNKPRFVAHLLVLFGFFAAAATAGLALIYMIIWQAQHGGAPFDGLTMMNPIKWLGLSSGLALIVGSVMMIQRRASDPDGVGAGGFADRLFLYLILLVAGTGMLTWLLRLTNVVPLAYPIYFIHLMVVFFLLWYMPYSKFAHMIYRALALVWAFQTDQVKTGR
ncbi:MAG: quinone-interacting membrane-bound oxidoreductase complex subunit QmoC [bacterium]